jgi:hypothetical protein
MNDVRREVKICDRDYSALKAKTSDRSSLNQRLSQYVQKLRCSLIRKLIGEMPVVTNVNIYWPGIFNGRSLVNTFDGVQPAIFAPNVFVNEERDYLFQPTRTHEQITGLKNTNVEINCLQ